MAAYSVIGRLSKKLDKRIIVTPFIRSYWNKDWQPGPYPETAEERAAAAKKYGMIPEDYKPFPIDPSGIGYGDYPKLTNVSAESRDPYEPYDFPEYRRNFGEPLNVDFDMYGEDRYNISARPKTPYRKMLAIFLTVWLGGFGLYCLGEYYKIEKPLMPKQYPYKGETHYTFEPLTQKEEH